MPRYGNTFDPVRNAVMESFSVAFDHTRQNDLLDGLLLFEIITDKTVSEYADWLGFDLNLSETSGLNAGHDLGVALIPARAAPRAAVVRMDPILSAALGGNHV